MIAAPTPVDARERARDILQSEGAGDNPPKPFKGILDWIGKGLRPVGRAIAEFFEAIGPIGSIIVIAAAVGLLAWLIARRTQHRRFKTTNSAVQAHDPGVVETAEALETAAIAAERDGNLALAVRLRFRAGLIRLDHDAGAISYRPSVPTAEVRAAIPDPEFREIADDFEQIAYAEREADSAHIERARGNWPLVLHSAKRDRAGQKR